MKAKRVREADWEWFGHSAHFICGRWCRFHMATKVGDYLVSTVGEYIPPHRSGSERAEAEWLKANFPGEDIGCDRKYETMVFRAGSPCAMPKCMCGLPSIASGELDFQGYNDAGAARTGHMALCRMWAAPTAEMLKGAE
jgi:hypothetical protein